jgi:hypothetical protein
MMFAYALLLNAVSAAAAAAAAARGRAAAEATAPRTAAPRAACGWKLLSTVIKLRRTAFNLTVLPAAYATA